MPHTGSIHSFFFPVLAPSVHTIPANYMAHEILVFGTTKLLLGLISTALITSISAFKRSVGMMTAASFAILEAWR